MQALPRRLGLHQLPRQARPPRRFGGRRGTGGGWAVMSELAQRLQQARSMLVPILLNPTSNLKVALILYGAIVVFLLLILVIGLIIVMGGDEEEYAEAAEQEERPGLLLPKRQNQRNR